MKKQNFIFFIFIFLSPILWIGCGENGGGGGMSPIESGSSSASSALLFGSYSMDPEGHDDNLIDNPPGNSGPLPDPSDPPSEGGGSSSGNGGNAGADNSGTWTIDVNKKPKVLIEGPSKIALNTSGLLNTIISNMKDPLTIGWSSIGPASLVFSSPNGRNTGVTASQKGTYTVFVDVTDMDKKTAWAQKLLEVTADPDVSIEGPDEFQKNESKRFKATAINMKSLTRIQWACVSPHIVFSNATDLETEVTSDEAETYALEIEVIDEDGTVASAQKAVQITANPQVSITGPSEFERNVAIGFSAEVLNMKDPLQFAWKELNNNPAILFSSSHTRETNVTATKEGPYTLAVNVTDADGKMASDQKEVQITELPKTDSSGAGSSSLDANCIEISSTIPSLVTVFGINQFSNTFVGDLENFYYPTSIAIDHQKQKIYVADGLSPGRILQISFSITSMSDKVRWCRTGVKEIIGNNPSFPQIRRAGGVAVDSNGDVYASVLADYLIAGDPTSTDYAILKISLGNDETAQSVQVIAKTLRDPFYSDISWRYPPHACDIYQTVTIPNQQCAYNDQECYVYVDIPYRDSEIMFPGELIVSNGQISVIQGGVWGYISQFSGGSGQILAGSYGVKHISYCRQNWKSHNESLWRMGEIHSPTRLTANNNGDLFIVGAKKEDLLYGKKIIKISNGSLQTILEGDNHSFEGIAFDLNNHLWVIDTYNNNNRILKGNETVIDKNTTVQKGLGGFYGTQSIYPTDIAIDGNYLYILDKNNRIILGTGFTQPLR